jgi:hypothetical protein
MQVAYNRLNAAQDQFRRANDAFFELGGKVSLELVLDARIRLADSETGYHRARIDYAVALKNVHFEKGSLLDYDGAVLASGESWQGAAADIARKKISAGEMPQLNYVLSQRNQQSGEQAPQEPAQELSLIPPSGAAAMVSEPTPLDRQSVRESATRQLPAEPQTAPVTTASDQP